MTDNFNPLVSIIIPVYNGENFMREAIDSALAQTYNNIEVIVINDGSTDNGVTREIALSYGDRIRYLEKVNGGVATALNMGINEMKGEYFSWLSHDDLYYPDKIEKQVNFLKQQVNRDILIYSNFDIINDVSQKTGRVKIAAKDRDTIAAIIKGYINGCTVLIPKKIFMETGLFCEELKTTQDYDFFFRALQVYPVRHLSASLIKSRIHKNQGSRKIHFHSVERDEYYINVLNTLNCKNYYLKFFNKKFFLDYAIHLNKIGLKVPAGYSFRLHCSRYPDSGFFDYIKYKSNSYSFRSVKYKIISAKKALIK